MSVHAKFFPVLGPLLLSALLTGCGSARTGSSDEAGSTPAASASTPAAEGTDANHGEQALSADDVQRMGIRTTSLEATREAALARGYGALVPRATVAGVAVELATAQSAATQSQAALQRAQGLASTAGAYSTEAMQGLVRQASADAAAVELAQSHLAATIGSPPWNSARTEQALRQLSQGNSRLVRVTFPLGSISALPARVQLRRLDDAAPPRTTSRDVWEAPADSAFPGRSFFVLINSGLFSDGERVIAESPQGDAQSGVTIPLAATVIYDNRTWCYVERSANHFARVPVSTEIPTESGYFVTEGIKAGDAVVTNAAGMLLSRETNTSDDSDD